MGGSRKDLFCFRGTPSSHSLSTAASRCILHANNSTCTIVHAAYNAFINVDDQMDFHLQSDVSFILSVIASNDYIRLGITLNRTESH